MAVDIIEQRIENWEIQCYGTTLKNIDRDIKESHYYEPKELEYLAMSILSDDQELIGEELNSGNDGWVDPKRANEARQQINIVKHILDIYLKTACYSEDKSNA